MTSRQYTVVHMFCGAGGGAIGLAQSMAKLGTNEASFRTLGGIDNDPGAAADFERLVNAPCIVGDVHDMQPSELHRVFGLEAPDFVLSSPPCKSFSALLSKAKSAQPEYQRMAGLAIKGVHLMLATWPEPPKLFFLENVPRIVSRGKAMLAQLRAVLTAYGYEIAEGVHDCGEVGGLAQHRRRWFLVARHRASLPRVVYQPPKRRVRGCGEVLGALPVPLGEGGPMHQMSMLSWCRLAAIPAGGDWRDLPGVVPADGARREVHRRHMVVDWSAAAPTIGGTGSNGACAVADPRAVAVAAYTLADVDQLLGAGDPRRPPAEIPIIMAADGTWHRPLTTLELAALQGFPMRIGGEWLVLSGSSTTAWRERIGNAIPVGAAQAIGEQMLRALLAGDLGQFFELSADPVWVSPGDHGAVVA